MLKSIHMGQLKTVVHLSFSCQGLYHDVFYLLLQRLQPPRRLQWPWQVSRKGLDSQNEEEVLSGLGDHIKCETVSQWVIHAYIYTPIYTRLFIWALFLRLKTLKSL